MPNHFVLKGGSDDYIGESRKGWLWVRLDAALRLSESAASTLRVRLASLLVSVDLTPGPTDSELFVRYRYLARYLAGKVVYGPLLAEFQDHAESQLAMIIMTQWDRFDPSRSSRTTWLSRMLLWYLLDTRSRYFKREAKPIPLGFADRSSERRRKVQQLSIESRRVMRLIRKDPAFFAEFKQEPFRMIEELPAMKRALGGARPDLVFDELLEVAG